MRVHNWYCLYGNLVALFLKREGEVKMIEPILIKATDLSDAWFRSVYLCLEHGKEFLTDKGSFEGQKRLEFDYVLIHITHPWTLPLLPKINPLLGLPDPVAEGYLDDYLPYLMAGAEKEGESYTYGQRICAADLGCMAKATKNLPEFKEIIIQEDEIYDNPQILYWERNAQWFNQMELMIWTYKNKGHRNNQMVLQVAQPSDMLLADPPCLRHIDTRIQDGKLHFYPYFRSWDLYSGFPANLAAIEMMKQYCAAEIGVENGEIIASSKGLHLYEYAWELAEAVRGGKPLR